MASSFPGEPLNGEELETIVNLLKVTPVSYFLLVTTAGDIWTLPPFVPTPEMPDLPSLLRYMADQMQRVPNG